jgi:hypothetical protein
VSLEERPDLDVLVPLRDSEGEVTELVRGDVDAARQQAVALLCRERPIVADDVRDRLGKRRQSEAIPTDRSVPESAKSADSGRRRSISNLRKAARAVWVVGRGFRNANRIEIAGTKTSLYVRSPLSHTG